MSLKDTCISAWDVLAVEIGAGAALTNLINLGGLRLFGIIMPSEWTVANLTFQMSPDAGTTWFNMLDQNGNEILASATSSAYISLSMPHQFAPIPYLRIRSGSSAVPITQTSTRPLHLLLRSL